jgi:hypothetical protein
LASVSVQLMCRKGGSRNVARQCCTMRAMFCSTRSSRTPRRSSSSRAASAESTLILSARKRASTSISSSPKRLAKFEVIVSGRPRASSVRAAAAQWRSIVVSPWPLSCTSEGCRRSSTAASSSMSTSRSSPR